VPNFIATLNHMGAVAIPMPGGEVYSSLQMGVIDGVEHDAPTIYASKYYEIIKNGTLTRHSYNPLMIAMNKKSFEQIRRSCVRTCWRRRKRRRTMNACKRVKKNRKQ
jgi:TRAP-type C4-dicarboxylate transport system substrate-binding protein